MTFMGMLIGFLGVGGAGLVISVLTAFFGIPIHTALGTSLGAMMFTTMSGALSHFRENNVALKEGLVIGVSGGIGAFVGVQISSMLPAKDLTWMTAAMLYFSSMLVVLQMFFSFRGLLTLKVSDKGKFFVVASSMGIVCGMLSGAFGIGAAPYIQIGLLLFFNLSIYQVAGTSMLVTFPIAFMGGFGYLVGGFIDLTLYAQVVAGLISGAYIGAKFTRRLPVLVLKVSMAALPILAATLMLLRH